jgi:hypothetical protein
MKILCNAALVSFTLFLLVTGVSAREMTGTGSESVGRVDSIRPADYEKDVTRIPDSAADPAVDISSTAAGGLWSAPSTWVGGTVPQASNNVTIVSGATVIIDTAAAAANVTIGNTGSRTTIKFASLEGGAPAVLTFGETAAFSLTVGQNVTIGSNDTFSTGSGNANAHVLSVGGDLTNNGTLDFSTNNNLAGAAIVFTGASSNTFGGTGAVTDIQTITINKGNSSANILDLAVSNFTVQGSTTDGPASGFLFLNQGTFKISGTFSGSHRTFGSAAYQIIVGAGLWLNNPNYTITPQASAIAVLGSLRVSAGSYNVGTDVGHSLYTFNNSVTTIEGGAVTIAGGYVGAERFNYNQTGGTLTVCAFGKAQDDLACFSTGIYQLDLPIFMTGGDIVIQNAPMTGIAYRHFAGNTLNAGLTGTTVRLGNASTNGVSLFRVQGFLPNIAIDTTAGGHTVQLGPRFGGSGGSTYVHNVNIGPGGILDVGSDSFRITGDSFVNNGILQAPTDSSGDIFFSGDTVRDVVFSGSGTMTGFFAYMQFQCHTFTFDPGVGNLRVRGLIEVFNGDIINSNKLTLGNNDLTLNGIRFYPNAGTFDSPLNFELGPGGQEIDYLGTRTTGPEINPQRRLTSLYYNRPGGTLTLTGGDLTIDNTLALTRGVILGGPNRVILNGDVTRIDGWLDGTLVRRITATGTYNFWIGRNAISPLRATVNALGTNPSFLSVTAVDTTLPGLVPSISVSRYWKLEETGDITATLGLTYGIDDPQGNEDEYIGWRGNGGPPVPVPGSIISPFSNTLTITTNITDLTGDWGVGSSSNPGPVSIGGTVTTSGGQPIRNATLTLTGGNLQAPITVQTGNFGTYSFTNLLAGETYTVRVDVKRYRFAQPAQIVMPNSNITNLNFVANPQE